MAANMASSPSTSVAGAALTAGSTTSAAGSSSSTTGSSSGGTPPVASAVVHGGAGGTASAGDAGGSSSLLHRASSNGSSTSGSFPLGISMAGRVPDAAAFVSDALTKCGILDSESARAYGGLFGRFTRQQSKKLALDWNKIAPPSRELVLDYTALESCPVSDTLQRELLGRVAIVKLNGGLGTSMGCKGSKSAIHVRAGQTFLDLTVRQVEYLNTKHGTDVPLILMNSFRTHEETVRIIRKYQHHNVTITCFTQSCFPRIDRDHYTPLPVAPFSADTQDKWYPPGHGDIYRALDKSGLLDVLLSQGKEYVFISNVDNLGATMDLSLLYHLVTRDVDFCMEVTDRTRADVQVRPCTSFCCTCTFPSGQCAA